MSDPRNREEVLRRLHQEGSSNYTPNYQPQQQPAPNYAPQPDPQFQPRESRYKQDTWQSSEYTNYTTQGQQQSHGWSETSHNNYNHDVSGGQSDEDAGMDIFRNSDEEPARRSKAPYVAIGSVAIIVAGGIFLLTHDKSGNNNDASSAKKNPITATATHAITHQKPSARPTLKSSPANTATLSPSATANKSASAKPTPTTIPKLSLKGKKLDCEPVATIQVSESIPIAENMEFPGKLTAADGSKTIDKTNYSFDGSESADLWADVSGKATVTACAPDLSKAYTLDTSNKNNKIRAYRPEIDGATTHIDLSDITVMPDSLQDKDNNNVPLFIEGLCKEGQDLIKAKKDPLPAENQACIDEKNWKKNQNTTLAIDMNNQLSSQAPAMQIAVKSILLTQLDGKKYADQISAAVGNYLKDDIQPIIKKQLGAQASNILIEPPAGDAAKQAPEFIKKNKAVNTEVASLLLEHIQHDKPTQSYIKKHFKNHNAPTDLTGLINAYMKAHPKAQPFSMILNDTPSVLQPIIHVTDLTKQ